MTRVSPTLEGFRAAFRRPSLTLAEISWRWTVGAAATALFTFSLLEYLDTLPVTRGDILLLRTRQPILIGQALGHIFRGSLPRVVIASLVAAVALTFLWVFAASVGRATTVRNLIDYFAERLKSWSSEHESGGPENQPGESISSTPAVVIPQRGSGALGALLRLNFLRAAAVLAAFLGLLAAVILVRMVSAGLARTDATTSVAAAGSAPPPNPGAGLAFLLFFPLAGLVVLAWSMLNWVLSLAGIFAVVGRNNAPRNAFSALSFAVSFCRERAGPVFAVSTWTGLAHLTVFVVATTAVSVPLGLAQIVPGRVVLAGAILVTVVYFAVVDWLYVVRLAGYVCIAETPEALMRPVPSPVILAPPASDALGTPGPPVQAAIDRDEPILSDVPNLALEN